MADVEYLPQLAFPHAYPKAVVSALPHRAVWPRRRPQAPRHGASRGLRGVFLEQGVFTVDGRSALAQVGMRLGLGAGDRVLLPAYHCRSMVEPFVWLGCEVDFFHLDGGLRPVMSDLESRIRRNTRLVVVADYFGFAQIDRVALQRMCELGVPVLRDCAHRLFLPELTPGVSAAIASLPKMLPLSRGGVWVVSANVHGKTSEFSAQRESAGPANSMEHPGVLAETRALARWLRSLLGQLGARDKAPAMPACGAGHRPDASVEVPMASVSPREPGDGAATAPLQYFCPATYRDRLTRTEITLARTADLERIAARRRSHYSAIADAVCRNRTLSLLFSLDTDTVPYVVPVQLTAPARQFDALRGAGIAIQRWEDSARTDCPTALAYRESLVQLPCHQDLTAAQVKAICHLVASI